MGGLLQGTDPTVRVPPAQRPSQIMISQDTEESWTVFVFESCALDPDCADHENVIKAWMYSQISRTSATAAIPALLIFIGAWFLAVDVRRS